MSQPRHVPRIALTRTEAAQSLSMSLTFFEEQVQPEVRIIRRGSKRLVPVAELQRWAEENAEGVLDGVA